MFNIKKTIAVLTAIILSLVIITVPSVSALPAVFEPLNPTTNEKMMLEVKGNKLVNGYGETVRLFGSNFSVTEYDISKYETVVDDAFAERTAKRLEILYDEFGANCARLVIDLCLWNNEDDPELQQRYRELNDYVIQYATQHDKYVWIDLHGGRRGYLPDEECVQFWIDFANKYKNHPNLLFGLFNEPNMVSWDEWYYGLGDRVIDGWYDLPVTSKGMQHLVDEIRKTGANNVLIADTIYFSSYFDGIISGEYALKDSADGKGIMYDPHFYADIGNDTEAIEEVAKYYPIAVGEVNSVMGHDNMVVQMDYDFFENFFESAENSQIGYFTWEFSCQYYGGNAWSMLKFVDESETEMTFTETGKLVSDQIKKVQKEKSVRLCTKDGYFSTWGGKYTASDTAEKGIELSEVNSIERSENCKTYIINFYENENYTGKKFSIYNTCENLKEAGLDFVPKSVEVLDNDYSQILENCRVTANNGTDTMEYLVDGTSEAWYGAADAINVITIELDDIYYLTDVFLWTATGLDNMMPRDYSYSVSTDGYNFTRIYDVAGNTKVKSYNYFEQIPAKYFRIIITKGNDTMQGATSLAEIVINGYKISNPEISNPVRFSKLLVGDYNSGLSSDNDEPLFNNNDNEVIKEIENSQVVKKIIKKRIVPSDYTIWIVIGSVAAALLIGTSIFLIVFFRKRKKAAKGASVK